MKDILLRHKDSYIECEIDDLKLIYTFSDDPKCHNVAVLQNQESYDELKQEVTEIYRSHENRDFGYDAVCDFLNTYDCSYKYFVENSEYVYNDCRDVEEIEDYMEEAFDKVWLMRNCDIYSRKPKHEAGKRNMKRIFKTYDDIPDKGYDTWECGYWNGIMGALRWVLGADRDFLDT